MRHLKKFYWIRHEDIEMMKATFNYLNIQVNEFPQMPDSLFIMNVSDEKKIKEHFTSTFPNYELKIRKNENRNVRSIIIKYIA